MSTTSRRDHPLGAVFRAAATVLVTVLPLSSCEGCLSREHVDSVEVLPYPSCGEGELPPGEVLASGHLRAGPISRDKDVVERWELRARDCLRVFTVRQEWPLGIADVEVVLDDHYRPLRAWKRMTLPGVEDPEGSADIRRYELRHDPPTMSWRHDDGTLEHRRFRGRAPVAVVGPGRALVGAWIRANDLQVGETVRGPVLDFRQMVEEIDEVALRRDPDRQVDGLGTVRVYTIFGRESVFTDADGNVVGDLAGLRPDALLDTPAPPPLPRYGEPDPVHTP